MDLVRYPVLNCVNLIEVTSLSSNFCRKAYEELQTGKEQEIVTLKEQNQRLQVQMNNTQLSLQDLKEKSSQCIQELESRVSLLARKVILFSVISLGINKWFFLMVR
jgi:hypothetical protein